MLFSATKDQRTNQLVQLFLKSDPMEIDVQRTKEEVTAEGLEQGMCISPLNYENY